MVPTWSNIDRDSSPFENVSLQRWPYQGLLHLSVRILGDRRWRELRGRRREGSRREMNTKRAKRGKEKKSIPRGKQVGAAVVMNIYRAAV